MTIDKAQSWWENAKVDLLLRRGESGRKLLEIAGDVGYSPYLLRRAVERITPVLRRWVSEGIAPPWAEKLLAQCKQYKPILAVVPPIGDEVGI